jgi:tartrate-resistant acid phosphatase type 5
MTSARRDKAWVRLLGMALIALGFIWAAACEDSELAAPRSPSRPSVSGRRIATPSARDDALTAGKTGNQGSAGNFQPTEPTFGSDTSVPRLPAIGADVAEPARVGTVRIVVLGDYGVAGLREQQVAELVHDLEPDYVLTTGDNNYPVGAASTIDANIGQYFSDFIYPYKGAYPSRANTNRFFPVLGNHDWYTDNAAAYLNYFTLPGNERYYDVVLGDVHFFALDSDPHEPDGTTATSTQARWLQQRLAASKSPFNIVAMHHPPYSSGSHGNTPNMQWPYGEWGADLVLAGHDHSYERLNIDGVTYVVSGLGGVSIYSFFEPEEGSVARYNEQYGVTILEADANEMRISFLDIDRRLADRSYLRSRR